MAPGRVRLHVWCEDQRQEQFVRALFTGRRFGMAARDLMFRLPPKGKGSAAQWVIANFNRAMQAARSGKHQAKLGVLVMVDGDNEGVKRRKRSLLQPPNDQRDDLRLAIWVPTRNIETWVKYLSGSSNPPALAWDSYDFKAELKDAWDKLLPQAIARWHSMPSPLEVPSLEDACLELSRLPSFD